MKEEIVALCKQIEKEHDIFILFAIESGSRLWRMESANSDYDVRFVYVHRSEKYFGIKEPQDVINVTVGDLDLSGFDIKKFGKLLSSSNPSLIEWLYSDIVYYRKVPIEWKNFIKINYNPLALYHHYRSMCGQNYIKYIKTKQSVTYKKYLYAMRGLVNAKLVEYNGKIPPIRFDVGLNQAQDAGVISDSIIKKLQLIIKLKKSGREKDIAQNELDFDSYIESFLKSTKTDAKPGKVDLKLLNELVKSTIKKHVD